MYMQRTTRGTAGNGLCATIKYMRGAAGNGLGTTIKHLRRTSSGASGNGLYHHDQVPFKLNAGADKNWAMTHIHNSWVELLLNPLL